MIKMILFFTCVISALFLKNYLHETIHFFKSREIIFVKFILIENLRYYRVM